MDPTATYATWRAQVEAGLAGKPFDKALVSRTPEGGSTSPLYVEAPPPALTAKARGARFRVCPRISATSKDGVLAQIDADLEGGADAVWLPRLDDHVLEAALDALLRVAARGHAPVVLVDVGGDLSPSALARLAPEDPGAPRLPFVIVDDPEARLARGELAPSALLDAHDVAPRLAKTLEARGVAGTTAMVSTLPYHEAGADPADELAMGLSVAARYFGAMLDAGLSADQAADRIAVQIAVSRDTLGELCKVRALFVVWAKLVGALGVTSARRPLVHAVTSRRTLAARDPWVNMLRATTQVFAGVLGGADLVTADPFDSEIGGGSLGRRVARSTGLVLREESHLGRVTDPAAGSYYLETRTDELAREAWRRFQTLEREGGVGFALTTGRLLARLEASWQARLAEIRTRKLPVLGVSEFANLGEVLPEGSRVPGETGEPLELESPPSARPLPLPVRRDAVVFERLRARAEAVGARGGDATTLEVLLVTLGTPAEARARLAFAKGLFAVGGLRAREVGGVGDESVAGKIVCLCGTDERYAESAEERARALAGAGAARVLLAGRPGASEASLREAGISGFVFMGCDVASVLTDVLEVLS